MQVPYRSITVEIYASLRTLQVVTNLTAPYNWLTCRTRRRPPELRRRGECQCRCTGPCSQGGGKSEK